MKTYRILVVEDERVMALTLERILHTLGHEVVGDTPTGSEAVRMARALSPDVVLMDVMLEGDMDGVLAGRIIAAEAGVPVVFLTSSAPDAVLEDEHPFASGYVMKPVESHALAAAIEIAVVRSRLERRIRESERKYRELFDNALSGIYRTHPDGYFLEANTTMARMLGYESPEQLMAELTNIREQLYVDPERRDAFVRAMFEQGEVVDFEASMYGRDGDVIWVMLHCRTEYTPDGDVIAFSGVLMDISDRKAAEENLKTTLHLLQQTIDSVPDLVFLTDLEHNLLLSNVSFREIFGLEEDAFASLETLLDDGDASAWTEALERTVAVRERTRFPMRANGEVYEAAISPYDAPDGELIGALYVARRILSPEDGCENTSS